MSTWREKDGNRVAKEDWIRWFNWAEMIELENGVKRVKCTVCSAAKCCLYHVQPKLDTLKDHAASAAHQANQKSLDEKPLTQASAATQVSGDVGIPELYDKAKAALYPQKRLQFLCVLRILLKGRPLTDVTWVRELLQQVTFANPTDLTDVHWSVKCAWEIADACDTVVVDKLRAEVARAHSISISLDEATSVDTRSYMAVHVYCLIDWIRISWFVALEECLGADAERLLQTLLNCLGKVLLLDDATLSQKLVGVGCDGASVLQGLQTGLVTRLTQKVAPFASAVHCTGHRTNLVGKAISKEPCMQRIESLIANVYAYFCRSTKRLIDLKKWQEVYLKKTYRVLRVVETRWISLLRPLQRVLVMLRSLVSTFAEHKDGIQEAEGLLAQLTDVANLVAMYFVTPLLEELHHLSLLCQEEHLFLVDLAELIERAKSHIHRLYVGERKFTGPAFAPAWSFVKANDNVLVQDQDGDYAFNTSGLLCINCVYLDHL